MSNFIAYHGGKKFESSAEDAAYMAKWRAWIGALGEALVDPGTPLGKSKTVSANGVTDGGGANPLTGCSIVQALSLDAAVEMARGVPTSNTAPSKSPKCGHGHEMN